MLAATICNIVLGFSCITDAAYVEPVSDGTEESAPAKEQTPVSATLILHCDDPLVLIVNYGDGTQQVYPHPTKALIEHIGDSIGVSGNKVRVLLKCDSSGDQT